jgi:hypothetical protein
MNIDTWLEKAIADATARGVGPLEPLLAALARSTRRLRAADWNDRADGANRPTTDATLTRDGGPGGSARR